MNRPDTRAAMTAQTGWDQGRLLVHNMPDHIYHADPAPEPSLSSTLARKLLTETPMHAWAAHPGSAGFEPTHSEAFDLGKACHQMLLGGGPEIDVIDAPDWRGKDAREAREASREAGRVPMLARDHDRAVTMLMAVQEQLAAGGLADAFEGATALEASYFAFFDGCWNRARPDAGHLGDDPIIYDFKTTSGLATPDNAIKSACAYGYDHQAAHYLDVVEHYEQRPFRFRFVFAEIKRPHGVCVIELSPEWLAAAREKAARARAIWTDCVMRNVWPGHPAGVVQVDPPVWHANAWEDRKGGEAAVRGQTGRDVLEFAYQMQAPLGRVA
jgi:hypothetical protein